MGIWHEQPRVGREATPIQHLVQSRERNFGVNTLKSIKNESKTSLLTVSTSIGSISFSFCKWPLVFGSNTLPMKLYTWTKSGITAETKNIYDLSWKWKNQRMGQLGYSWEPTTAKNREITSPNSLHVQRPGFVHQSPLMRLLISWDRLLIKLATHLSPLLSPQEIHQKE